MERKSLFCVIQQKIRELQVCIYNVVEIEFVFVILLILKWPSSLCTQRNTGEYCSLMDLPVHGKQIE